MRLSQHQHQVGRGAFPFRCRRRWCANAFGGRGGGGERARSTARRAARLAASRLRLQSPLDEWGIRLRLEPTGLKTMRQLVRAVRDEASRPLLRVECRGCDLLDACLRATSRTRRRPRPRKLEQIGFVGRVRLLGERDLPLLCLETRPPKHARGCSALPSTPSATFPRDAAAWW